MLNKKLIQLGLLSLLILFCMTVITDAYSRFNRITYPVVMEDDAGNTFKMDKKPERIISTMPGITEMLFSINLDDRIVGVTKFCNYPEEETKDIPKVGGLKMNLEMIVSMEPDLIIMDGSAQEKDIARLMKLELPVFVINPNTIEALFKNYETLGVLTANYHAMYTTTEWMKRKIKWKEVQAKKFYTRKIKVPTIEVVGEGENETTREAMIEVVKYLKQVDALVIISRKPVVAVGKNTFIDDLLKIIGVKNVIKTGGEYPKLGKEQIFVLDPDVIITTSDVAKKPEDIYKDSKFKYTTAGITKKVLIIDPDIISRPGPRLVNALNQIYDFVYNVPKKGANDEEN